MEEGMWDTAGKDENKKEWRHTLSQTSLDGVANGSNL